MAEADPLTIKGICLKCQQQIELRPRRGGGFDEGPAGTPRCVRGDPYPCRDFRDTVSALRQIAQLPAED
jgi:hypothetical protein